MLDVEKIRGARSGMRGEINFAVKLRSLPQNFPNLVSPPNTAQWTASTNLRKLWQSRRRRGRRVKIIAARIRMESASIDTTTGPAITGPATKIEIEMVIGINDQGIRGTMKRITMDHIEASIRRDPIRIRTYQFQTTKSLGTIFLGLRAIHG